METVATVALAVIAGCVMFVGMPGAGAASQKAAHAAILRKKV